MIFNHYSSLYLDFKQHELKISTLDKYTHIIDQRILPTFKDQNIAEIKPSDVKKWLYSIDDVGNKSKRHYLGVLSGIFQEALYDEVINRKYPHEMDDISLYHYYQSLDINMVNIDHYAETARQMIDRGLMGGTPFTGSDIRELF